MPTDNTPLRGVIMPIENTPLSKPPDCRAELAALRAELERLGDLMTLMLALLEGKTAAALEDARDTRAWLRERLQEKM